MNFLEYIEKFYNEALETLGVSTLKELYAEEVRSAGGDFKGWFNLERNTVFVLPPHTNHYDNANLSKMAKAEWIKMEERDIDLNDAAIKALQDNKIIRFSVNTNYRSPEIHVQSGTNLGFRDLGLLGKMIKKKTDAVDPNIARRTIVMLTTGGLGEASEKTKPLRFRGNEITGWLNVKAA